MTPDGRTELETVILGAGMSGLCMAIALAQAGRRDFVVVEKGAGLGGTWWDNRYPGAQVDVPAPLYSFSFAPNPRWTQRFAHAPEIQAYMDDLARRHGLAPHLRFGTTITGAAFDEATGRWTIALDDGRRLRARFFVCSTGPLSVPRWPDIEGLASFAGERLHTARWAPSAPLAGRRVGVIGTGSTAAQLVPAIAPEVARLSVFQRTANWVMPRMDRRYGLLDHALARIPPYPAAVRWFWAGASEWLRRAFDEGTLARRRMLGEAHRHLRRQVRDEALRARLGPPYPFGCKRIIFSNDYYPALARPNVELVTDPLVRVTPTGIVTADGREHALDLLVCATGFDVQHSMAVPIAGRGGAALQALWRDGAFAHLGITVAGFPNLFLMLGPNTGTGHTSTLLFIEAEVRWAMAAMDEVRRRGAGWIDVRESVMRAFNDEIAARLDGSVWSRCRSWYRADNGRIIALWPGFTREYRRRVAGQRFEDFEFGTGGGARSAP
jgi:cation diffusion facilitator CzcD-associated flavoprotein CzcO